MAMSLDFHNLLAISLSNFSQLGFVWILSIFVSVVIPI